MNNLEKYLTNHREELMEKKMELDSAIEKLSNENIQIELKITDLTKNLDTTFEVFSPNSMLNDYNVSEIEKLKTIYQENQNKSKRLKSGKEKIDEELNEIDSAIRTYKTLQTDMKQLDDDNTNMLDDNEINQKELCRLAVSIPEFEIKRFEKTISQEITQILDSLLYKEKLCEKFIDMDLNRSKLELIELKEGLNTLQNKAYNFMFHVKHSSLNNNFFLVQNIKNHIKKYNISSDIVTITNVGEDIIMPSYDIENNIRIIDELINNSISHGKAKNININISVVSSLDKNEIIESTINYDLKEESNNIKNINVSISDDGCGFDSKIIDSKYSGLGIVRKRLELYMGEINIKSSNEFGTTVNYNYQYVQ